MLWYCETQNFDLEACSNALYLALFKGHVQNSTIWKGYVLILLREKVISEKPPVQIQN